jgi:hypothetical protein
MAILEAGRHDAPCLDAPFMMKLSLGVWEGRVFDNDEDLSKENKQWRGPCN